MASEISNGAGTNQQEEVKRMGAVGQSQDDQSFLTAVDVPQSTEEPSGSGEIKEKKKKGGKKEQ